MDITSMAKRGDPARDPPGDPGGAFVDHVSALAAADPAMPEGIYNRAADN
jgi:hypothetical protein